MNALLNMPLRQVLRIGGFYVGTGIVLWLPVIVALARAGR